MKRVKRQAEVSKKHQRPTTDMLSLRWFLLPLTLQWCGLAAWLWLPKAALYLHAISGIVGLTMALVRFFQSSRSVRVQRQGLARVEAEHEVELRHFSDDLQARNR
jgi:hypothetical protein